MLYPLICSFLVVILFVLFFSLSKAEKWEIQMFKTFECGFSSYFFSRFSFSIHFFLVGMIFLLLDLEICLILPFALEMFDNFVLILLVNLFMFFLLLGLFIEWLDLNIDWKT